MNAPCCDTTPRRPAHRRIWWAYAAVLFATGCDELTVAEVQTEVPNFDIRITCRNEVLDSTLVEEGYCQMDVGEVDTLEMTFLIDSVSVTGLRVSWIPFDSTALSIRTLDRVVDSVTEAGLTSSERLGLTRKAEVVALRRGVHEVRFDIDSAGFLVNAEQRDTFNLFLQQEAFFQIRTNERWAQVSAGRDHTCALTYHDADTIYRPYFQTALRSGGKAFCWGINLDGALGTGDFSSDQPEQVASDAIFKGITAGDDHTCALDSRRLVFCWGRNEEGQLGTGDELDQFSPRPLALGSPFNVVSPGEDFTCGVPSGQFLISTVCWGRNGEGQLGCDVGVATDPCFDASVNDKGDQLLPSEDVKTTATADSTIYFSRVAAGARHACGLVVLGEAAQQTAWCWGDNSFGQVGVGVSASPLCDKGTTFPCERAAVQVQGPGGGAPLTFQEIAAGGDFTCAVAQPNQVYCWGRNNFGQLGNGTTVDSDEPVQVIGDFGMGVGWLTVGETHACVLNAEGAALCWGANADGQLGDSTTTQRSQAVAVVGGHVFNSIAAGFNHTCGVLNTIGAAFAPADYDGGGPIFCWGSNGSRFSAEFGGKLGTGRDENGMLSSSVFPVRIAEPLQSLFILF